MALPWYFESTECKVTPRYSFKSKCTGRFGENMLTRISFFYILLYYYFESTLFYM